MSAAAQLSEPVLAEIRQMAREIHRFNSQFSGCEFEDVMHEGIRAYLEASERGASVGSSEMRALLSREMRRAARYVNDSGSSVSSYDGFTDEDGSPAEFLATLDGRDDANEFVGLVPSEPGARLAFADECTRRLDLMKKEPLRGITKHGERWRARAAFFGARCEIGSYASPAEARDALKSAYASVRSRCYPLDPRDKGNSYLAKKKQTLGFWRAMADECRVAHALPQFMYWNPLDALIFLDDLSADISKARDTAYAIESRDHSSLTRLSRSRAARAAPA